MGKWSSSFLNDNLHRDRVPIKTVEVVAHYHGTYNIWEVRQGFKVTEQRLCDQAKIIRMNWWQTALEMGVVKKGDVRERNYQDIGGDNNDQGETTDD